MSPSNASKTPGNRKRDGSRFDEASSVFYRTQHQHKEMVAEHHCCSFERRAQTSLTQDLPSAPSGVFSDENFQL